MTVFIAREKKDTKQAISRIVDAFADKLDLSRGVFVKPNIVFPVKERSGQVTKHRVVKALVEVLRERHPKVDIILGEGAAAGAKAQENFKVSGYLKLADELGVPLLDLDEVERVKVKWGYGFLKLPKLALERTYISLPILKRSSAAGFSGAMKMQKGLLLPQMKKAFHKLGLHKPIAELNVAVQPALTILDFSNFASPNFLVGADNTHEVDLEAVRFLGITEPEYVRIGRELGISAGSFEFSGDQIAATLVREIREEPRDPKRILGLRFWVSPRTCSMCRFLFQDVKHFGNGNLFQRAKIYGKLLSYAVTGADIVLGYNDFSADPRKVICVGECTKKMAHERGYRHVGGCPPSKADLLRLL